MAQDVNNNIYALRHIVATFMPRKSLWQLFNRQNR